MAALRELPNIGAELEKQLNNVGINTYDELVDCGSQEAWLKIKGVDPTACVNRLMSLEGAIQGVRWHSLSDTDKSHLKDFYNKNKSLRGKSYAEKSLGNH